MDRPRLLEHHHHDTNLLVSTPNPTPPPQKNLLAYEQPSSGHRFA